jgi:hypothetical protein
MMHVRRHKNFDSQIKTVPTQPSERSNSLFDIVNGEWRGFSQRPSSRFHHCNRRRCSEEYGKIISLETPSQHKSEDGED